MKASTVEALYTNDCDIRCRANARIEKPQRMAQVDYFMAKISLHRMQDSEGYLKPVNDVVVRASAHAVLGMTGGRGGTGRHMTVQLELNIQITLGMFSSG